MSELVLSVDCDVLWTCIHCGYQTRLKAGDEVFSDDPRLQLHPDHCPRRSVIGYAAVGR